MRYGRHLVIFARASQFGVGKRRLAKDIGDVEALRFARVNLTLTLLRLARDSRWTTWLAVTPDRSSPWPSGLNLVPQGKGDLGRRMMAVLQMLPPGPAVIVGSDIPGMRTADVAPAFQALGNSHAVFGPATDGGYWLVGLRRTPRRLNPFRHVKWSSEHALRDTLRNLAGYRFALLDPHIDVDDGASLSLCPLWCRLCPPPRAARTDDRRKSE